MKTYEALLIFHDTLKDDAVNAEAERSRGEIEKLGGRIVAVEVMGKRAFARTLKRREAGFYVRVTFDMDPEKIASLTARYKLIESLFRVQIVTAPRKPMSRPAAGGEPAPAAAVPVAEGGSHGVV